MIKGALIGLRARHPDDVPVLHKELHENPAERVRTDARPWLPVPVEESSFRVRDADASLALFSVVELSAGEPLVGAALLWGVDRHQRMAHVGISLLPAFRGRGLSTDTVRVLCEYAFVYLSLHRVQLETLADNRPMIAAAQRCGFVHEGTLRENAWVNGTFADEAVFGLLRDEWVAHGSGSPVTGRPIR